jgi:putative ABC transport system ATP-binding protein
MIELEWVSKVYKTGAIELRALDNANLRIEDGDLVAIMGASGSGKSTMMNILGCLDSPTSGIYRLDGIDVGTLRENALADIRNKKIGFVFQSFNLIPRTSAVRNVELPLVYGGGKDRRARAQRALERVGLGERMGHMPNELSGGQQQRVAVARALVTDPTMILADEPTGNLDTASTIEIMNLFVELNDSGRTVVLITHEPEVASFAKRVVTLRDGHIISDVRQEQKRDQVVPDDGHTERFAAVTELAADTPKRGLDAPKHALDAPDDAPDVDPGEPTRPVLRKDLGR